MFGLTVLMELKVRGYENGYSSTDVEEKLKTYMSTKGVVTRSCLALKFILDLLFCKAFAGASYIFEKRCSTLGVVPGRCT